MKPVILMLGILISIAHAKKDEFGSGCVESMSSWCQRECRDLISKKFGRRTDFKSECSVNFDSVCAKCECIRRTGFQDENGDAEELNEGGFAKCDTSAFKKEICEAGCSSGSCERDSDDEGRTSFDCVCGEADVGYADRSSCLSDCGGFRCTRAAGNPVQEGQLPQRLRFCNWECSEQCYRSSSACASACDEASGLWECAAYDDDAFPSSKCFQCARLEPECLDDGTCEIVDGQLVDVTTRKPATTKRPKPVVRDPPKTGGSASQAPLFTFAVFATFRAVLYLH